MRGERLVRENEALRLELEECKQQLAHVEMRGSMRGPAGMAGGAGGAGKAQDLCGGRVAGLSLQERLRRVKRLHRLGLQVGEAAGLLPHPCVWRGEGSLPHLPPVVSRRQAGVPGACRAFVSCRRLPWQSWSRRYACSLSAAGHRSCARSSSGCRDGGGRWGRWRILWMQCAR